MDDQANILQKGVEIGSVRSGKWQHPLKGIGGKQQEQVKPHSNHCHHRQHPRHQGEGHTAAIEGYCRRPARQDQHPQQQGAFMGAPYSAEFEIPGQQAVGVVDHVEDRKIILQKCQAKKPEADGGEHKLTQRQGPGGGHPDAVARSRTQHGHHRLDYRQAKTEDQAKMTNFRIHGRASWAFSMALFMASVTSGGI